MELKEKGGTRDVERESRHGQQIAGKQEFGSEDKSMHFMTFICPYKCILYTWRLTGELMALQWPRSSSCACNFSRVLRLGHQTHTSSALCIFWLLFLDYNSYDSFIILWSQSWVSFRTTLSQTPELLVVKPHLEIPASHKHRFPLQVRYLWSWPQSLLPPMTLHSAPFLWYDITFWACWNWYLFQV